MISFQKVVYLNKSGVKSVGNCVSDSLNGRSVWFKVTDFVVKGTVKRSVLAGAVAVAHAWCVTASEVLHEQTTTKCMKSVFLDQPTASSW